MRHSRPPKPGEFCDAWSSITPPSMPAGSTWPRSRSGCSAADRLDLVDGSGAVVEEAVKLALARVAACFLVDLNLVTGIDRDGGEIAGDVRSRRPRQLRQFRIAEAQENPGIVVTVTARMRQAEVE